MCGYYKTPDLIVGDIEYFLKVTSFQKKTMDENLIKTFDYYLKIFYLAN